jgi:2-phosphosulfolactate phosphatase
LILKNNLLSISTLSIEVIVSPLLFPFRQTKENCVVVVVDVFRVGTTICVAFGQGVDKIIPVSTIEETKSYKEKGFLVAGERGGIKLDFADFGNSPFEISSADLKGKTLVVTSTNGTQAIEMAKDTGQVAIGTFSNLSFITEWLLTLKRNVVIFCSGWQQSISLEDTLFAGALTDTLVQGNKSFEMTDSAYTSIDLWNCVKADVATYLQRGTHYQRLVKLGAQKDLDFAVKLNTTKVIPVYENYYLTNILK